MKIIRSALGSTVWMSIFVVIGWILSVPGEQVPPIMAFVVWVLAMVMLFPIYTIAAIVSERQEQQRRNELFARAVRYAPVIRIVREARKAIEEERRNGTH